MKVVAFERAKQGTGASRRLRNAGKTPGIIYGGDAAPQLIEVEHNPLWYALQKEAFHASVLDIEVDGKVSKVLLRDVQYHPYKQLVLHVDFQRVSAKEKLTLKVPLHFKGEEVSDAVKLDRCMVNRIATDLEITCLPADLPEAIEVDLSHLKKGMTVHLSNLTLPKGVTANVRPGEDPIIVSLTAPKGGAGSSSAAEEDGETPAEEAAES